MSDKILQKLDKIAFASASVMGNFVKVAQQKRQEWLSSEGQALIEKAKEEGSLASVHVPVCAFQVEGLHSVKDVLIPKTAQNGRQSQSSCGNFAC